MITGVVGYATAGVLVLLCLSVLVERGGKVNKIMLVMLMAILIFAVFEIVLPLMRIM